MKKTIRIADLEHIPSHVFCENIEQIVAQVDELRKSFLIDHYGKEYLLCPVEEQVPSMSKADELVSSILDTLVFGHTPTLYYAIKSRLSIWHGQNRIAIDCGSGFEDIAPEDYPHQGRLACLRLDDMKEFYSREKRRTSKGDEP